jgi:hypothetical protein
MSTTSLPANARRSTPKLSVRPPILASDILREEVAPRAPARTTIRVWLGAFAAACALSAVAAQLGFGPHTSRVFEGSLVAAAIAAVGAAVPAPYLVRAIVAVLAGTALLGLGALDRGPLAPLGHEGFLPALARLALATLLPAALLFRARFRAFRAARIVLTVALVCALPAVALGVLGALDAAAPLPARIADGIVAAAALTGLFGFMGAETSAGCDRWAALILVLASARVAVRAPQLLATLAAPHASLPADASDGAWGYVIAAIGTLAATTIAAFGLFQILAIALGSRARTVDVHQIAAKPDREEATRDREEDYGDDG